MKTKSLQHLKNNLLRAAILPLLVVMLMLGAWTNVSAQKYELTGVKSQITQATEITLSNSTNGKFYYLFLLDENDSYQYLRLQVGQGIPLIFGSDFTEKGTYVVYEFDDFKGLPFDLVKYKPSDGNLQEGSVIININSNN